MSIIKPTEKESNLIKKLLSKMTPQQILDVQKAFQSQKQEKLNEAIIKAENQICHSATIPFKFFDFNISSSAASSLSEKAKNPIKYLTDLTNDQFTTIMTLFEKLQYVEVQRVEFLAQTFKDIDWIHTIQPISSTDWAQKLTVNHANHLIKELNAQLEFWEEIKKWSAE